MLKNIRYFMVLALAAVFMQSCEDIEDKYMYGDDTTISWNAAADSATASLISHFWDTTNHYFVYVNDEFPYVTDPGYWPQAHAMDVIIDAYLRTGNEQYKQMFGQWYEGIKAVNFSNRNKNYLNNFYDDSEWIGLTMLRLYDVTKEDRYLNTAKDLWEWIKTGWTEEGGGGIAWEHTSHMSAKNSCSNGPAAILAARLYNYTKDESCLEWAKKIYEWQKKNLFNQATGAVYDGLNAATGELSGVTLSYNQGTFLGAAHELYKITGDKTYINDARKAAYYGITSNSNIDTGNNVLRDEGNGDGGLFKGIFMRYYVQLILDPDLDPIYANKFKTFFRNNAETLWRKGTNKKLMLFGTNWATAPSLSTQLTMQISGASMIEAMALYDKSTAGK